MQRSAIAEGYDGFSLWGPTHYDPLPTASVRLEVSIRTDVDPHNDEICADNPGERIADGLPGTAGLHWDWVRDSTQVQLSLEADQVPAGTDSVLATCTIVDNGGSGWPEVGSTTTVPLWLADSYSRWTSRFATSERTTPVYVGYEYLESGSTRSCEATAYDADGGVLTTFPLVGGTFRPPHWENVAT